MAYPTNRYVPNTYKRECDRCGFDFLRSELYVEEKTLFLVCKDCLDKPHPRDNPPPPRREPMKVGG